MIFWKPRNLEGFPEYYNRNFLTRIWKRDISHGSNDLDGEWYLRKTSDLSLQEITGMCESSYQGENDEREFVGQFYLI